ncbi:MAG: hypothetical protein AAF717_19360 [Bacteroidota bacterium]
MPFGPNYYRAYQGWPERLVAHYADLSFDHHCYLRIALDNTFGTRWDTKIRKPAYQNLSEAQLNSVLRYFRIYFEDRSQLMAHHQSSLNYRTQWKRKQLKFAL